MSSNVPDMREFEELEEVTSEIEDAVSRLATICENLLKRIVALEGRKS